jgi:hypothetical protein
MQQPAGFQLRLGWSGWLALALALGLIFAVAAAVAVVLIAVLLVLLPVAILAAFVYYLFPGLRARQHAHMHELDIIEGQYRVVDPTKFEPNRSDGDPP